MLSNIITYDETITSDDYEDKKIKSKVKWNQINLISMESVLGSNCRIPLLHMSKRKVFIEVTNEKINEFSFAYMCNPHLHINKMFTEQVKICLSRTFGTDTVKQINIIINAIILCQKEKFLLK